MTRMTITVDPELMARAQAAVDAPTRTETIRIALTEIVRTRPLNAGRRNRDPIEDPLDRLRDDFDALVARMQTPDAKAAGVALFSAAEHEPLTACRGGAAATESTTTRRRR